MMVLPANGLFQNTSFILETTLGYFAFIRENSSDRVELYVPLIIERSLNMGKS
jgi:hypothetical protein